MAVEYEAFGVIEMNGWLGLIDVVDAMSKATEIDLIGYTNGPTTSVVIIAGDGKSVLAVLEVGRHIGLQYDEMILSKVIPHPHPNTQRLIQEMVQSNGSKSSLKTRRPKK